MRYLLLCCTALLAHLHAGAQIRGARANRGSVHLFANLSGDLHINGSDVRMDPGGVKGLLESKNTIGTRIGFDVLRITRYRMIVGMGYDFRFEPQKLRVNYVAADMGYTGSDYSYSEERSFTNMNMELKGKLGYSIKTGNTGAVDITTGLVFSLPVNGRADTPMVAFQDMGNGYKEPLYFIKGGWGNQIAERYSQSDDPRLLVLFQGQIAYRFLQPSIFGDRALRFGLDFSYMPSDTYNNRTEVTTFGPNRRVGANYRFSDKHCALGLSVGIEL